VGWASLPVVAYTVAKRHMPVRDGCLGEAGTAMTFIVVFRGGVCVSGDLLRAVDRIDGAE